MIHRFVFHNDRMLPIEDVRLSPGQAPAERLGTFHDRPRDRGNSVRV